MGSSFNVADLLSQAASSSLPQQGGQASPTTMGPAPLAMPTPLPRFQSSQVEHPKAGNEFSTVSGRKRADRQSVFSNMAQIVKAGGDYIQARKNRQLESDITRLISAQEGEKEAQQAMQQAQPGSPEYQKAEKDFATNRAIHNDIVTDPKKSKQLQKAFNIDLFGNGKNKQENAALANAMSKWQQEKAKADKEGKPQPLSPIAQKFQGQQPVRSQISPELSMQAKMIQAKLIPGADEKLKAATEQFKSYTAAKSAEERNVSAEKIAKERAEAVTYHADKVLDAAIESKLGREAAADIHARTEKYKADMQMNIWNKRIGMMTEIATGKNTVQLEKIKSYEKIAGDKNKTAEERVQAQKELNKIKSSQGIIKSMADEARTYNTELQNLINENTKNQVELDKKGSTVPILGIKLGAATGPDAQILRNKIMTNNLAMRGIQMKLQNVQKKMDTLNKMGALMLPESASDAAMNEPESNDDPEKLFGDN